MSKEKVKVGKMIALEFPELTDEPLEVIQKVAAQFKEYFNMLELLYQIGEGQAAFLFNSDEGSRTFAHLFGVLSMGVMKSAKELEDWLAAHGVSAEMLAEQRRETARGILATHNDLPAEVRDALLTELGEGIGSSKPGPMVVPRSMKEVH